MHTRKFHIIIIDSGWPTTAHQVLQESTGILKGYFANHGLIILSKEDSQDFLKDHPEDIGKDPIVIVTDTHPSRFSDTNEASGIRIDLGKISDKEDVIRYLQDICILIKNETFVSDISWEERKKLARTFFKDIVGNVLVKALEMVV